MKKIKTYKAFDENLKCIDFQFKVGETYKHKGEVSLCRSGFHSCTNPFDVLNYYHYLDSRFCECEAWGDIDSNKDDSKIVSRNITIVKELSQKEFNIICIDWLISETQKVKETDSGYYAKIGSSGDSAQIGSSGSSAQIDSEGQNAVISAIGYNAKIKGKKGSWITLAEYDDNGICICVKSAKITGRVLKEDTYYTLKNKKFTEV